MKNETTTETPVVTSIIAPDKKKKVGKRSKKSAPKKAEKRGRKSIDESMSPTEIKAEVNDLIAELKKATDIDDKKRIRRALRRRGHKGGLKS